MHYVQCKHKVYDPHHNSRVNEQPSNMKEKLQLKSFLPQQKESLFMAAVSGQ